MTDLHPTFAMRDAALRAYCAGRGVHVGSVGVCRSRSQQITLRRTKPNLAADPYAIGPISPWGWRSFGSLHMEQADGFCHAIDYTISGCTWSTFHAAARGFGIVFPMATRPKNPEPWHGQTWTARDTGGMRDAPMLEGVGLDVPIADHHRDDPIVTQRHHRQEADDMYETQGFPRPGAPWIIDFVNLPADGQILTVLNRAVLYVKRPVAATPPTHVRVFANGAPLGPSQGADTNGYFFLPEDGRPIALRIHIEGYWSVEGVTQGGDPAPPLAVAQCQSWYTG